MVYVFPDSICGKLLGVERHRYINTAEPMPYETCTRLEDLFEKMLPTDMQGDGVNYLIRTRSTEVSDTTSGIFIIKTAMTYAAVVLFIICFTILALHLWAFLSRLLILRVLNGQTIFSIRQPPVYYTHLMFNT